MESCHSWLVWLHSLSLSEKQQQKQQQSSPIFTLEKGFKRTILCNLCFLQSLIMLILKSMPFFPAGFHVKYPLTFCLPWPLFKDPLPSFDFPEVLPENEPFSFWLLLNFTCLHCTSWISHYHTCFTDLQTFIHSISTYWIMESKAGHSSSGDWVVWYEDYQLILDSSCLYCRNCSVCHSITQNPEITGRQMK